MPSVAPRERGPFSSSASGDGVTDNVERLLLHEKVIGVNHVHHGGARFVKELANLAIPRHPAPGTRVLNIGCGFGGFGFQVASDNPNVTVHVCDPNEAVIEETRFRLRESYPYLADRVHLESKELDDLEFPASSFDAIVCLELNSFVTEDKNQLLSSKFKNWLTPGGKLVTVDYCWSERFQLRLRAALENQADSSSLSPDVFGPPNLDKKAYTACLKASYPMVWADDRSSVHLDLVRRDLLKLEAVSPGSKREATIKRECTAEWKNLCGLLSDNSLTWILFCATTSTAV